MAEDDFNRAKRDVSAIMRKVHSTDTSPERAFRHRLDVYGIHYLASASDLPGKPDVILPSKRIAIFIDGDFWHGHQWRKRRLTCLEDQFQKSNSRDYWLKKIRRNMARDLATTAALISTGWVVLRFFESDISTELEGCMKMVLDTVEYGATPTPYTLLPQRTFAEFFAGIGLMRLGLEKQGWTLAFANDIDERKYEMYRGHFQNADLHWFPGDIHKIPVESIPTVSLATASFPCTDLSLAGSRKGLAGSKSSAFWGFVHVLEKMGNRMPPIILLENVPGFLTSHQGDDFRQAMLTLNRLGYKIDTFLLDAAHFVPQSRQRLFVVGLREDNASESDQALHSPNLTLQVPESDVRPKALVDYIKKHPEIQWHIRNLPNQPSSVTQLQDILEDFPEHARVWWSMPRAEYLLNQMSPRHREIAERMIAGSTWSYGTVFRRMRNGRAMAELRTDGIAGCLRTPKGGSAKQILFKAGQGKYFARLITPREAARLMGADEYEIVVPRDQALFGFGDAVCVPVIEWIVKFYFNPLVNELIRGRALGVSD